MTTNRKIVLDNKLKFIKESSNWYKNNGYCNKPFKWNFKIFHVEPEVLYDICTQLVENDFVYSSIKWNKSADYDVRGWVLSVYTIAAFTEEALTNIRMKMEMWLHDMTQEAFSSYSYLNTNSKDDKEHDEGIKLKGDIIEFEPFRIPKRTVQNTNWEERWHKSLNKELKLLKEPLKEFSTDKLDKAFIDVQNSKEDATNTWVEFLTFVLKGKSIYFTDLRPGPCEDGVNVKLDKGNYDAFVYLKSTNNLPLIAAIKLVIKGSKYSERNQVGSISVDGGSVGF